MPDEADPEILEIVGRQLRQYIVVDRVVVEGLGILLQLQPAQPGADIHRHGGVRFTGSDAGAPSETAARSLSIKCHSSPSTILRASSSRTGRRYHTGKCTQRETPSATKRQRALPHQEAARPGGCERC